MHAIFFLKELKDEERKLRRPLDECVEKLLDNFGCFISNGFDESNVL